jgi:DNA-binding MarR family transcriptional regulator
MKRLSPTSSPLPDAISELILEVFRLNGRLLEAGDALLADIALTSARWQVLGAIALSAAPLPVSHIARNMGLSRQAVQRLANEMEKDGLVFFAQNPHHERAKLVLLTPRGREAYQEAMARQAPWAKRLASGIEPEDIKAASGLLHELRVRLSTKAGRLAGDNTV